MANHDPILSAAEGTMRKLRASRTAPTARLLAEVGSSFDLDAAQRADLADIFASEIHAEHIQLRLAAERAQTVVAKSVDVPRWLGRIAAVSFALAMANALAALAATGTLTSAKNLITHSLRADSIESAEVSVE